jgi:hypothetical protein
MSMRLGRVESCPLPKQAFAGSNPVTRSRSRLQGDPASDQEANIKSASFIRRVRAHALALSLSPSGSHNRIVPIRVIVPHQGVIRLFDVGRRPPCPAP